MNFKNNGEKMNIKVGDLLQVNREAPWFVSTQDGDFAYVSSRSILLVTGKERRDEELMYHAMSESGELISVWRSDMIVSVKKVPKSSCRKRKLNNSNPET